jgi:hypothetical protein
MFKKLLILPILILLTFGCGESNEEPKQPDEQAYQFDSTDLKLEKLEEEEASFSLKYKFNKGDKFSYRFTSISSNQQSLEMDTLISALVKQTITYLFDLTISEVDKNGVADITINIKSIKLDADINGEKIDFNTSTPPDSIQKVEFTENYSLTGNPFEIRVDSKGEIIEFSKVDRVVNTFLELREMQDSATVEDKNMLKNNFIQGMIKPLALQLFRILPTQPVAKDSSWSIIQQPMSVMVYQLQNENIFTVSAFEKLGKDRIAVVDATINSKITGDDKVTEGGVTYTFKKPQTLAEGKIYFNVDRGLIIKSRTKTEVTTDVTVEGMTPQGMQKTNRRDKNANTNLVELL